MKNAVNHTANSMGKKLDHKILLEMMLQMSKKGEELTALKGKQVIDEFVRRLKPYYE